MISCKKKKNVYKPLYNSTKNINSLFGYIRQKVLIFLISTNLYEYLIQIKPIWHKAMLTEVEYLSLYISEKEYLSIYSIMDIPNELKVYSSAVQQYPNLNIGNVAKEQLNCILFYRYINELIKERETLNEK